MIRECPSLNPDALKRSTVIRHAHFFGLSGSSSLVPLKDGVKLGRSLIISDILCEYMTGFMKTVLRLCTKIAGMYLENRSDVCKLALCMVIFFVIEEPFSRLIFLILHYNVIQRGCQAV